MVDYHIIPLTTAPSQQMTVTLNGQVCTIKVFTKSINVPISSPGAIISDSPVYQNTNPLFLDLSMIPVGGGDSELIIGGAICHHAARLVRDTYLGFIGDLAFYDTQGTEDPYGVPRRLPPYYLQNPHQMALPRAAGNEPADKSILGICPGLGTRFILTYWPGLT